MECDAFYVTVFKSLRFYLSTLETKHFQNYAYSNVSTFETVFGSLRFHRRFGRFCVDYRRKRIKKYAFQTKTHLCGWGLCQPKVEYLFERPYLPHSSNLTTLCDIRPVSINFQKAKTTIKTKRVGTNSHLRCFLTHATDKKYARTISTRFPPHPPYNVEPA